MQVNIKVGDQPLPVRMRLGAVRHQGVRALPSMRMPGVLRVLSVATLGLQLLRIRRVASKPGVRARAIAD